MWKQRRWKNGQANTFTSNNRGLCNTRYYVVRWSERRCIIFIFHSALWVRIFKQRKIVNNERANTMESTWNFFCSFWWCFACKPVIILFTAPPFTQTHTHSPIDRFGIVFDFISLLSFSPSISIFYPTRFYYGCLKNHLPIDGDGGARTLRTQTYIVVCLLERLPYMMCILRTLVWHTYTRISHWM